MKRLAMSVLLVLTVGSPVHSQRVQDVGAGVISFLLRSPKSADRMSSDQRLALDIIGDLLLSEGQRRHQLEYAVSGRSQIIIQTGDGQRAQFVRNQLGEMFLVVDGVIYPIAAELVRQATQRSVTTAFSQSAGVEWDSLNAETGSLLLDGRYLRAAAVAQQALEVAENSVGEFHPAVAKSVNNLAAAYHGLGRFTLAEPLYERSLAIKEKTVGPNDRSVATTLTNLAKLYRETGRASAAKDLEKRAAAIKAIKP